MSTSTTDVENEEAKQVGYSEDDTELLIIPLKSLELV
jgi:hypothetical protein